MSAIGPGDWLICVHSAAFPGVRGYKWPPGEGLTEGALYQVADCFEDEGRQVVALVGKERLFSSAFWSRRVGYHLRRFRPAFGGNAGAIRSQKQPSPELEDA